MTWAQLEARFLDLLEQDVEANKGNPTHAFQEDSREPEWYVGSATPQLKADTLSLCAAAGRKLKHDGLALSPRLSRVNDDVDRWLWYLVAAGETTADARFVISGGGQPDRHTYQHQYLLHASASGCKKLLANEV